MYKLVYVTAASEKEAKKIARVLIEERLVACVNLFPIDSTYRWKGEVLEENEVAMFIKTKAELVDGVIKRVKKLHSYEVPCIVSLPIEKGYTEFLKWVNESTKR